MMSLGYLKGGLGEIKLAYKLLEYILHTKFYHCWKVLLCRTDAITCKRSSVVMHHSTAAELAESAMAMGRTQGPTIGLPTHLPTHFPACLRACLLTYL